MFFHLPVVSLHLLSFSFRLLSLFISFPFFPFIFCRLQYTKKRQVVLFSHTAKCLQITGCSGTYKLSLLGGPTFDQKGTHPTKVVYDDFDRLSCIRGCVRLYVLYFWGGGGPACRFVAGGRNPQWSMFWKSGSPQRTPPVIAIPFGGPGI